MALARLARRASERRAMASRLHYPKTDGASPRSAGVIRDAAGALFGTAGRGGAEKGGVVFELTPYTPNGEVAGGGSLEGGHYPG